MSIEHASPRTRFEALLERKEADIDLIDASLLISAEHNSAADLNYGRRQLDALTDRALQYFQNFPAETADSALMARRLCTFLNTEEGFCGNREDYYNPDNSYVDYVLRERRGIPITLALLYIHIARSLSWQADGVGFPGHFLVTLGSDDSAIIDPFAGEVLSREDCRALLQSHSRGTISFSEALLQPIGNKELLQRMLRNLKMIYLQQKNFEKSLGLCDWLLLIDPNAVQDIYDRALVLERLACYGLAADELERLINMAPLPTATVSEAAASQKMALLKKIEHLRQLDQSTFH